MTTNSVKINPVLKGNPIISALQANKLIKFFETKKNWKLPSNMEEGINQLEEHYFFKEHSLKVHLIRNKFVENNETEIACKYADILDFLAYTVKRTGFCKILWKQIYELTGPEICELMKTKFLEAKHKCSKAVKKCEEILTEHEF